MVSPVTVCVVEVLPALLSTPPAGFEMTVYPVIALPPLLTGAVKLTLAWALPPVAVTSVGAPGGVAGVTLFEASEGTLEPIAFVATTVKVYAIPLVSPVITWDVAVVPALLSTPPAGFDVTTYPVIALPPVLAGAVNVTVACVLPGVAVTFVGGPGAVAGVTLFDGNDCALDPMALVATTLKV